MDRTLRGLASYNGGASSLNYYGTLTSLSNLPPENRGRTLLPKTMAGGIGWYRLEARDPHCTACPLVSVHVGMDFRSVSKLAAVSGHNVLLDGYIEFLHTCVTLKAELQVVSSGKVSQG